MARSVSDSLVGRTIAGKFLIEELIGAGAMGAVFRARQIALEKTVAIKVLHGEHADDPAFVTRFQREAKAASRLNHPNSMQVIDFGAEPDGLLYIAMEYLDGRSLHRVLREDAPLGAARIADILMQTLAALAVAHDMGVVHRDLKPDNIMILSRNDDDGRPKDVVKVCDFGIAKISDSRSYRGGGKPTSDAPATTIAGLVVGTPEYMSPEQGRGFKLDARSDLYSVGIILFEMLTGRVPFETENAIGTILKHINEAPPRPSELAADVDPRLEAVCMRVLRKAPEERYGGAREMRAELRAVLDGNEPIVAVSRGAYVSRPIAVEPGATATKTVEDRAPGSREAPKPTLAGTVSTLPGSRKRGRAAFVLACAGLSVGGGAAVFVLHGHRPTEVETSLPGPASQAPMMENHLTAAPAHAPPQIDTAPPAPLETPQDLGDPAMARVPVTAGSRAKGSPTKVVVANLPTLPTKVAAAGSATPAVPTLADAKLAAPPPASAAPAPPQPAEVASAAPQTAEPDPSFDPNRGHVEVGLVNTERVHESAVRGLLHNAGLSTCYRSALRANGAPAGGVSTLDLSFDGSGVVRGAILEAGFLPSLTRCVQNAVAGQRIDSSQVESSGGTAEVWLAFKVP